MLPRIRFEWDEEKNRANRRKHGVSFEDATAVFQDRVRTLEIFDADHSVFEDRFLAIGPTKNRLLVVVFTEPDEHHIRILSARRADENERALYRRYSSPPSKPGWPK